jgi:putative SOS response-associated peptidase YedK
MCGRFVITSAPAALRQLFGYIDQPNFPSRYNIAPTQPVPVVTLQNGVRRFQLMRWGVIPAWVKDPRKFPLLINARAETLLEKPAFQNAMKRRRCLIPADGYYEWQQLAGSKRPVFIHRRDGEPFGFAALMETWLGADGEEVDTVAIVTSASAGGLAALHHRVPVTIAPDHFERWLDCRADETEEALELLAPSRDGDFVWHQVSTRVNRTANDDAQLILPVSVEEIAEEDRSQASKKAPSRQPSPVSADDGQGSLF